MNKLFVFIMLWMMSCLPTLAQAPMDGGVWKDNTGKHINATWWNIFTRGMDDWYGESRSQDGKPYSSRRKLLYFQGSQEMDQRMDLVLPAIQ